MMLHFKAEINRHGNVYIFEKRYFDWCRGSGTWVNVALNQIKL